jgi:pSer/pThr/pTyr-binding forkhead associated (FHA) protein
VTGSIAVDTALLALKIGFLVLLYLFIWMIVRSATRDVRAAPQESIVIGAAQADELRALARAAKPVAPGKFRVVASPTLARGELLTFREPLIVGRAPDSGLRLDDDEFASSHHARISPADNGLWIEDLGSTNGTFVNAARVTTSRQLLPGDLVKVGETELRVEA